MDISVIWYRITKLMLRKIMPFLTLVYFLCVGKSKDEYDRAASWKQKLFALNDKVETLTIKAGATIQPLSHNRVSERH